MSGYHDIADWFSGFHRFIGNHTDHADLAQAFPFPPESFTDLKKALEIHKTGWNYSMRSLDSGFENSFAKAINAYQQEELGLDLSQLPKDITNIAEMNDRGCLRLPSISSEMVTEMRDYLAGFRLTRDRLGCPEESLSAEELRQYSNVGQVPTRQVIHCPHLVELASSPEIIGLITGHFGALPTIVDYAAWHSFAKDGEAEDAQLFHFDMDNYKFCKLFIYLVDVDEQTGPHMYIPGSHRLDVIREKLDQTITRTGSGDTFDQWYYMKLRKEDQEVADFLGIDPIQLTGSAGSCFLTNTRGIHKGLPPLTRDRFVIQVEYALMPVPTELVESSPVPKSGTETIPARSVQDPISAYLNRLYLHQA